LTPEQEKAGCPRCGKDSFNSFRVKRAGTYMEICKCKICGFLFSSDENVLDVAKAEVKQLFINDLRGLGKNRTNTSDNKEGSR
jgi:transcription elongation factor Elf1